VTSDDEVDLLPGASACTLVAWSAAVVAVSSMAGLVVLVLGTARAVPPLAVTGAALAVGVALVLGAATAVIGTRRSRAERRRGYTTFAGIAAQDASFTYVHRRTREVLARAGQRRGSNGRALVLDPSGATVPGRSAGNRNVVALWCLLLTLLCLPVIGFESTLPGNVWVWGGGALAVVLVLLVVSGVEQYGSGRTADREAAAGYATLAGRAVDDPTLTYRDRKTLAVRALPGEPVPVGSKLRPRTRPAVPTRWSLGPRTR
jgi:hypothetical protein